MRCLREKWARVRMIIGGRSEETKTESLSNTSPPGLKVERTVLCLGEPSVQDMSALDWLGGPEEVVLLQTLVGQWRDERSGSMCILSMAGGQIDVLTIRATGSRIFTKSLIHCHGGDGVVWGRNPQREFKMALASKERVTWVRGRREQFSWRKLQ